MPIQALTPPLINHWIWSTDPNFIEFKEKSILVKWGGVPHLYEGCTPSCEDRELIRKTQKVWLEIYVDCVPFQCDPNSITKVPFGYIVVRVFDSKILWKNLFQSNFEIDINFLELSPRLFGEAEFTPKPGCDPVYPFDSRVMLTEISSKLDLWSFDIEESFGSKYDFCLFRPDENYDVCSQDFCSDKSDGWYAYLVTEVGTILSEFPPLRIPIFSVLDLGPLNESAALLLETEFADLATVLLTSQGIPFIRLDGNKFLIFGVIYSVKFKRCPSTSSSP